MDNPVITTARLMLRPWSIEDGPALARLTQDPGFVEFSTFSPLSGDEAREFLASRLEIMQTGFGIWAVVENQQIIGNVQLLMQTLDDSQERLPEIGYRLQKSSWGRGFATEAATAIRDYAIHTMKLNPVNAFIDLQNTRSQSVAKKLGFSPTVQACFKGSNIQVWSYTLLN